MLRHVVAYLRARQVTVTSAESCTAGLIAALLADVEGAGEVLECGFVAYTPEAKMRCLGVHAATIDTHGLTSEAVAAEMAGGALRHSPAVLAIANTGVADGSQPAVPAGTQCFAWALRADSGGAVAVTSQTLRLSGDRHEVRIAAARHALSALPLMHERLLGMLASS
ncbi:CinA family protein [Uliginosibacterium sp. H1]|uniref:CinA family protein n=1 Tax=Uliginosibacterium sp. H1 TaxID=3114757 RepID=UPI002E189D88|nr:CinA family protein [Uliginosibacterium sp. H1]